MDIVQVCRSKDMILPCYQLNIDIVCVWVCLCSNVRMNEGKTVTAILDFFNVEEYKIYDLIETHDTIFKQKMWCKNIFVNVNIVMYALVMYFIV